MRTRCNRLLAAWKALSKRGKQIRLLSLALTALCVALAIVSIAMIGEKAHLDEQARQDTILFLEEA